MSNDKLKYLGKIIEKVLKAEKTTAGRVNLICLIAVLIVGALHGELFTIWGTTIVIVAVASAIFADLVPRYKKQ